jgi:hypothetical protein
LPREATCGKVEIVSAATPEPPPPPPSGSPFGRFPTQLLGLVAVAAAGIAAVSFSMSGGSGGGGAGPPPSRITGTWHSLPGANESDGVVQLELARSGGTLTVGGCTGDLTPRGSGQGTFRYVDTSRERSCPRVLSVDVSQAGDDKVRVEARRRSGREYVSETLRRVG